MATYSRIKFETQKGIAIVSLDRAEKHNGLDGQMFKELMHVGKRLKQDRTVKAVILKGNGESFCAGLDFSYVAKHPSIVPKLFFKWPWSTANGFQKVANLWRNIPCPVIAAIHGHCFGGGLQIALGCDFRVAHPNSQLSLMEAKWGLIPDMSGLVSLPRLMREDQLRWLIMTGQVLTGDDLEVFGLVTEQSEKPFDRALEMAESLLQQSPDALMATKRLIEKTWASSQRKTLFWERWIQLRILGRPNNKIAMKNGLSKTTPRPFKPRSKF